MKSRQILFVLLLFITLSSFKNDRPVTTIFMIGDSTMANKSTANDNPERGWGQTLPDFFSEEVHISNHAMNGRSSKSFIDEGRWDTVLREMKAGDYLFIQFGHNDEKRDSARYTSPGGTFDDNLRRFVNEARSKGGIPVLFSSIVRRNFNEAGVLVDTHGDYLKSPENVARELDVTFIDLNKITHRLVQDMGVEESKKLFMWIAPKTNQLHPEGKEDNTHLNVYGGKMVAGLAAEAIAESIPALAKYIRK